MFRKTFSCCLVGAIVFCFAATIPGLAQPAPAPPQKQADQPIAHSRGDEGELIELEEVQIHGEIAQPNVAITVARAEPQFREISMKHTQAEGMTDLDLSGLRTRIPPAERIGDWEEMLERPRQ